MKHWLLPVLFTSLPLMAQSAPAQGDYEERPGVAAYIELMGEPSSYNLEYKVMNKAFDATPKLSGVYGAGAHLPLYNWLGLNGFVGFQQVTVDYAMRGDSALYQSVLDSIPALTEDDLKGQVKSRNLLIQAGAEVGIPFYTNYQSQLMLKALGTGGLIFGKTFLDDSKFENTELFGLAGGAGVRMAWGPFGLEAGARLSYVYTITYFDPAEKTGEDIKEDTFMFEYYSPVSPYLKVIWSLY